MKVDIFGGVFTCCFLNMSGFSAESIVWFDPFAGGAGGRKDPARVRVADLAQTAHDPLLQQVRKKLREEHSFPRDPKAIFRVPCVFSPEPPVFPPDCDTDLPRGCDHRYGTASFVTGTFGFVAAAIVSAIATDCRMRGMWGGA